MVSQSEVVLHSNAAKYKKSGEQGKNVLNNWLVNTGPGQPAQLKLFFFQIAVNLFFLQCMAQMHTEIMHDCSRNQDF